MIFAFENKQSKKKEKKKNNKKKTLSVSGFDMTI